VNVVDSSDCSSFQMPTFSVVADRLTNPAVKIVSHNLLDKKKDFDLTDEEKVIQLCFHAIHLLLFVVYSLKS
jgi:hypothetical protein